MAGPHDFYETGLCDKITSYELTFEESGEYQIYIHGGDQALGGWKEKGKCDRQRESGRVTEGERDRKRERKVERGRDREREKESNIEREREREEETERQRKRDRQTDMRVLKENRIWNISIFE